MSHDTHVSVKTGLAREGGWLYTARAHCSTCGWAGPHHQHRKRTLAAQSAHTDLRNHEEARP
ncbi:hypothetical protein DNL40_02520 [Xylanimonas oleitrophica]|uniref:Uncharacterized protein n=1 Tax=Xylanimonas oleitrophica TaxID=2607479 RepID=A0A2W5Y9E2_9MICO|nr:hypothetical protein [Xylanimonas oleitrophica]PZR55264.1 hypothetical protein DNL40_02520 [Xylanimonas oleitrophica]